MAVTTTDGWYQVRVAGWCDGQAGVATTRPNGAAQCELSCGGEKGNKVTMALSAAIHSINRDNSCVEADS